MKNDGFLAKYSQNGLDGSGLINQTTTNENADKNPNTCRGKRIAETPLLINFIVASNHHGNNFLILNYELSRNSKLNIDRNRVQMLKFSFQFMQSQRGMKWIDLQNLQSLFVLIF